MVKPGSTTSMTTSAPAYASGYGVASKEKRPVRVFRQGVLEICFLGVFELLGIYYDVRSSEPAIGAVRRGENVALSSSGTAVRSNNRKRCLVHFL